MEGDAQKAYDIFFELFSKLFGIAFPYQNTKMCPKKSTSCLTKGLKKSIRKKHKLYKAYLTSPPPLNFKFYSSYRNKLHHLLRIAKRQHYETKFNESGNNMKSTWSIINEIIKRLFPTKYYVMSFKGDWTVS